MKKGHKGDKEPEPNYLFPDMGHTQTPEDKVLRDELHLATLPLAYFPGKRGKKQLYELTIPIDEFKHVKLVGAKSVGGIPQGHDLDYLYAAIEILYEQTQFMDDTIYFLITDLIEKAGRKKSQDEIQRAIQAITRYRYLIIQSNAIRRIKDDGKEEFSRDDISYIQHFSIVGEGLRRGRKRKLDATLSGYCKVIFTKFFMQNILSKELSKPLNYSLMMKIKNPKGKKLFRMIDAFRVLEGFIDDSHHELVSKNIFDIARRLPLTDSEISKFAYIKRSLDPLHEELKGLHYLSDYFYKDENGNVNIVYVFSKFTTDQASAYNELIAKGITANVAENLVISGSHTPEKILDVIRYYEYKKEETDTSKGHKKIDPGYIITTLSKCDHEWIKSYLGKKQEEKQHQRVQDEFKVREKLKMFYELDIESAVDKHLKQLSKEDLASLKDKARVIYTRGNPPKYISEQIASDAIEGIVRTILRKGIETPSFEKWLTDNKERLKHIQ
jgi:hypothetical protein